MKPPNERPDELVSDIIDYLTEHGLAELSLRPLAKAVGSSPRVLLYYFGSKELLIAAVFTELRARQRAQLARLPTRGFAHDCWVAWRLMSDSDSLPLFRLFFEAVGIAIRDPERHREFLAATVEDWLAGLAPALRDAHTTPAEARTLATIVVSGLRGFLLDLCATGDDRRVDRAVRAWIAMITPRPPPAGKRASSAKARR